MNKNLAEYILLVWVESWPDFLFGYFYVHTYIS